MLMKPEFFQIDFRKKTQIPNFIKIRSLVADLFHADGQTDGQDVAKCRFSHVKWNRIKCEHRCGTQPLSILGLLPPKLYPKAQRNWTRVQRRVAKEP